MPAGSPHSLKCPKCHRGQYGYPPKEKGCRPTGNVEARVTKTKMQGHGKGGAARRGHRGEAECLDCGHRWYSTHPLAGWKGCYFPAKYLPWCCLQTRST